MSSFIIGILLLALGISPLLLADDDILQVKTRLSDSDGSPRSDDSGGSSEELLPTRRVRDRYALTLSVGQSVSLSENGYFAAGQGYAGASRGGVSGFGSGGGRGGSGGMPGGAMGPNGTENGAGNGGTNQGVECGSMRPVAGASAMALGSNTDPLTGLPYSGSFGRLESRSAGLYQPLGGGILGDIGGAGPLGGLGASGTGGTATNLSARFSYFSTNCIGISVSAATSIPEASTLGGAGENTGFQGTGVSTTNLSASAIYSTKTLGLSFLATTLIPNGSISQPTTSQTPTPGQSPYPGTGSGPPGSGAMILLMPSARVSVTDNLSVGATLSYQINYLGVDDSIGVNGPRTPGYFTPGLSQDLLPDTTVLTMNATYALSRRTFLSLNVPYGFTSGLLDPTAGVSTSLSVMRDRDSSLNLNLGLFATAPASLRSQEEAKITTVTGSLGPMYRQGILTLGLTSQISYSFYEYAYRPSSTQSASYLSPLALSLDPTMSNTASSSNLSSVPDQLTTRTFANMGLRLSREVRTTSSIGVNYLQRRDGTLSWGTLATPFSVTYTPGAFSFSAFFSLTSDRTQDQAVTMPNQPFLGGSISLTLGN